ncbi:MAG: bifunctional diaminohydroxyphosphoribosylaminopyrimidine deaminase/5-amino-6-(5-phosphoribosylamino)uracil reductase RibD [Pseudomonadota bacterium]
MSLRADRRRMAEALRLAEAGQGRTGANPSVGCVICDRDGHVIAAARTGDGGRPHAEESALEGLGSRADGGTAYVTLEPCRQRSTGSPSCSERLLAAGIARVVVAIADEHPQGAGGNDRLQAAGVRVSLGLKQAYAARLYRDFFEHAKTAEASQGDKI